MIIDMKKEWKNQIDRLDIIIRDTSVYEEERLSDLYEKRGLLLEAFNRVCK